MLRILLTSSLLLLSQPAFAIYKCNNGEKISYRDTPCTDGKGTDITDQVQDKRSTAATETMRRTSQQKQEAERLAAERHKREAQDDKARRIVARSTALKAKKCASLAQRVKWANEDAASASGKAAEKAKRKARRITDSYQVQCSNT